MTKDDFPPCLSHLIGSWVFVALNLVLLPPISFPSQTQEPTHAKVYATLYADKKAVEEQHIIVNGASRQTPRILETCK